MANCMMLESTVIAPTAMSPPYFSSEELKHTVMRLSVDCMMKGEAPRARAAPRTPMPKAKMKMGSSTVLRIAPISTVFMPTTVKPWAVM